MSDNIQTNTIPGRTHRVRAFFRPNASQRRDENVRKSDDHPGRNEKAAEVQRLIFSEYEANGVESGDTITFPIARGGQDISLTVAGYYEDPFMGSSMIGMKGFLISEKTYEEILSVIEESGMDALARDGSMIHMETAEGIIVSEMNRVLTTNTPLSMYTEFTHSGETIAGLMMILQNAFSALFAAFAVVLLGAALAVMGHSISGLVEQEWKNFGILKTIGFTGRQLAGQVMMQYMTAVGSGVVMGMRETYFATSSSERP